MRKQCLIVPVALSALVFLAGLPALAGSQPPPATANSQDREETNTHGRVPFIPDTDPVFAGTLENIKDLAKAIRAGHTQKPLIRDYARLYPRLYPFDHPLALRPAVPVAATRRPEAQPAWTFVGPTNIPGRMTALVRHPSDANTLYMGAADGGVWKTTDAGQTWTSLTDASPTLSIGSLAINPSNPAELWAGTGEGNFALDNYPGGYVYHTTDGGSTWTPISHAMGDVRGLAVKPDAPSTLFAAASKGIFKSTDAGQTWTLLSSGIPAGVGTEILVDPTATSTVYAALGRIYGNGANGIYKSTDGGATFAKLSGGLPATNLGRISVAMAPSQTSTLYAAIQDASTFDLLGLFKSTDAGSTWTQLSFSSSSFCNGQCWYDLEVAVDPADPNRVYIGGVDTYRSTNGGTSFIQISQWYLDMSAPRYVHADQHALVATSPGQLWAGCDGGVSYSSNGGDSWTFLGKGLNTTQYYNIAMHPTKANWTLGGTQDNGTHLFSGSTKFAEVYGGDGGYCAISPANPSTMYEEYVYLDMNKSIDGGSNWAPCSSGISPSDPVLFIAPFVMDPTNPSVLYAGTDRVYRTTDAASNWFAVTSTIDSSGLSALGVSPATGQVAFAGGIHGGVYRTGDAKDPSPNWFFSGSGLPNRSVTSFAIAPDDQTVYMTFSGTGTAHIWKSADQGNTWAPLTAGLPDEPFDSVVLHPADPSTVYAGSDFGAYASFDAGATWSPYGAGLPRVAVDSLSVSGVQNVLQAGTHGRGIWQAAAVNDGTLSVQPTAVPASGNAPLTVAFLANAVGGTAPYTYAWDYGDGSSDVGQSVSHAYSALGQYTCTLTVTDGASHTASGTVAVSVVVPPPSVTAVSAASNPFKLKVTGTGFKNGAVVKIDGQQAPSTVYKSATLLQAKGSGLKALVPKGQQVQVTVMNPDGSESAAFPYTR